MYLTVAEVAKDLRVSTKAVHEWIKGGRLVTLRAGKLHRIRPEDLEAFLRRTPVPEQPPAA